MSAANEVKNQLHVYHNPFSSATAQPKIPDGKATMSLGFAQQSVEEIQGTDIVQMLIFPGLNGLCLISGGITKPTPLNGRSYYIPRFSGSNVANWSGATDATTNAFNVSQAQNYAYWRCVSAGVQLKLLNSVEEDDGWWESCRLTVEMDNDDWMLTTVDNGDDPLNDGILAPVNQLFSGINLANIANEPTYSTGLLRDLHRVQFELHSVKELHDFIHMADDLRVESDDIDGNVDKSTDYEVNFKSGRDGPRDLIEKFTDTNMDMVYIKLHCRPSTASTPSRFHLNQVMNHEVIFDPSERESRFMTRSHNIGAGSASLHATARKLSGMAAHPVI